MRSINPATRINPCEQQRIGDAGDVPFTRVSQPEPPHADIEKFIAGLTAQGVVGDGPTYISFDIDSVDPAFAPGTGTPEVGGFTTQECLALIRGLRGVHVGGADVVEVTPPFDPSGTTALVAATMLYELLCVTASSDRPTHLV